MSESVLKFLDPHNIADHEILFQLLDKYSKLTYFGDVTDGLIYKLNGHIFALICPLVRFKKPMQNSQHVAVSGFSIFRNTKTSIYPVPAQLKKEEGDESHWRYKHKRTMVLKEALKHLERSKSAMKKECSLNDIRLKMKYEPGEIPAKGTDSKSHPFVLIRKQPGMSLVEWLHIINSQSLIYTPIFKLRIAQAIMTAMKIQLIERKLCHSDLKPDNIMVWLDPNPSASVIDFEFSQPFGTPFKLDDNGKCTIYGTKGYLAPEHRICGGRTPSDSRLQGINLAYNPAADVYSIAKTLSELILPYIKSLSTCFQKAKAHMPSERATFDELFNAIQTVLNERNCQILNMLEIPPSDLTPSIQMEILQSVHGIDYLRRYQNQWLAIDNLSQNVILSLPPDILREMINIGMKFAHVKLIDLVDLIESVIKISAYAPMQYALANIRLILAGGCHYDCETLTSLLQKLARSISVYPDNKMSLFQYGVLALLKEHNETLVRDSLLHSKRSLAKRVYQYLFTPVSLDLDVNAHLFLIVREKMHPFCESAIMKMLVADLGDIRLMLKFCRFSMSINNIVSVENSLDAESSNCPELQAAIKALRERMKKLWAQDDKPVNLSDIFRIYCVELHRLHAMQKYLYSPESSIDIDELRPYLIKPDIKTYFLNHQVLRRLYMHVMMNDIIVDSSCSIDVYAYDYDGIRVSLFNGLMRMLCNLNHHFYDKQVKQIEASDQPLAAVSALTNYLYFVQRFSILGSGLGTDKLRNFFEKQSIDISNPKKFIDMISDIRRLQIEQDSSESTPHCTLH